MSQKIREEMLPRLRQRYANRGVEGRSRMITEVCEQFGYSRKHAIKLLGAQAGWGGDPLVRKNAGFVNETTVSAPWRKTPAQGAGRGGLAGAMRPAIRSPRKSIAAPNIAPAARDTGKT